MIDLYTWTTPNGRKISIALEEMGLRYNTIPVNIRLNEQFAPDFLEISPNNKIPAIIDHDTQIPMMESGAILLYLAGKSGKLLATDARARLETVEWLMWQVGGFGPMLGQAHHFLVKEPGKSPHAEARFATEAKRLYGVLDRRLEGRVFVTSEYSIADIAIWPWVSRFQFHKIDLRDFPNILRWYVRIAERPAVQRGYAQPLAVEDIPIP